MSPTIVLVLMPLVLAACVSAPRLPLHADLADHATPRIMHTRAETYANRFRVCGDGNCPQRTPKTSPGTRPVAQAAAVTTAPLAQEVALPGTHTYAPLAVATPPTVPEPSGPATPARRDISLQRELTEPNAHAKPATFTPPSAGSLMSAAPERVTQALETPQPNTGRKYDTGMAVAVPNAAPDQPNAASDPATRHLTVRFASGSAKLDATARERLALAVADANVNPGVRVLQIDGRTDDRGTQQLNDALASERGLTVRNFLRDHGLRPEINIEIRARGRSYFVADNATEAGRALNRRAELRFGRQRENKL